LVQPVAAVPHLDPVPTLACDVTSCVPPGLINRTYVGVFVVTLLKTLLLSQALPPGDEYSRVLSLIVL
jgi:hypothetical protein